MAKKSKLGNVRNMKNLYGSPLEPLDTICDSVNFDIIEEIMNEITTKVNKNATFQRKKISEDSSIKSIESLISPDSMLTLSKVSEVSEISQISEISLKDESKTITSILSQKPIIGIPLFSSKIEMIPQIKNLSFAGKEGSIGSLIAASSLARVKQYIDGVDSKGNALVKFYLPSIINKKHSGTNRAYDNASIKQLINGLQMISTKTARTVMKKPEMIEKVFEWWDAKIFELLEKQEYDYIAKAEGMNSDEIKDLWEKYQNNQEMFLTKLREKRLTVKNIGGDFRRGTSIIHLNKKA